MFELEVISSSSFIAVPDTPVFKTGLVRVLFVSVEEDEIVGTATPSTERVPLLPLSVVAVACPNSITPVVVSLSM